MSVDITTAGVAACTMFALSLFHLWAGWAVPPGATVAPVREQRLIASAVYGVAAGLFACAAAWGV